MRRAHAVHPSSDVQTEYSLWTRDPEDGILAACEELGITFVACSPRGRAFVTGPMKSPDDLAPPRAAFQGDNFAKNLEVVSSFSSPSPYIGLGTLVC